MRILVTVIPLSGHVAPVTGLVGELIARGHDVRVYTGARHHARFAALGARIVPWVAAADYDEHELADGIIHAARGSRARRMMAMVRDQFIGTAPGQVQDLQAELTREPADVLIADSMSFGGVLTGELAGLPWALVNVLPFNQTSGGPPPLGLDIPPAHGTMGRLRDRAMWTMYSAATMPFNRAYNKARQQAGLPVSTKPYGADLMSPWLVLATGCATLGDDEDRLLNQIHYVGRLPLVGLEVSTGTAGLRNDRPLVVVTQGTHDVDASELLQPALAALSELDVDVVATTGRRGHTDLGIPVPANAQVVDLVDFTSLLPRASVVVSNGGWGGVLMALGSGVPLVVAPSTAADKPYIARRVARSGAGINLRTRTPSPRAVGQAVRAILADPAYARRAAEIADELVALGGRGRAADLVEELAATRRPVLRS